MTAFLIVAGTSIVINVLFILMSLIYTYAYSKWSKDDESTLSVAHIMLHSYPKASCGSLPQVAMFNAMARLIHGSHHDERALPNTTVTKIREAEEETK